MAPRPFWKGYLKLSLVTCPVALTPATTDADKVRFHTLNRKTGNRVVSRYVDAATGKPVDEDQEVKGYARDESSYVLLEDEELEAVRARERAHHRHRDLRPGRQRRLDLVRHALLSHAGRQGRRRGLLRHSRRDALDRHDRHFPSRPPSARARGAPQVARQRHRALDAALRRRRARPGRASSAAFEKPSPTRPCSISSRN